MKTKATLWDAWTDSISFVAGIIAWAKNKFEGDGNVFLIPETGDGNGIGTVSSVD